MLTLINGQVKNELPVSDRGLLYGDGLFETIAFYHSCPILLPQHLERLSRSCKLLRIDCDFDKLNAELKDLLAEINQDGIIKIIVTRGQSGRGYKGDAQSQATRIIQFFTHNYLDSSNGKTLGVSSHRLCQQSCLAGLKHLNRLDQVMASFDIDSDIDEVVCLDSDGSVIEGSKSNIIVTSQGILLTPDTSRSGVSGVFLEALLKKFETAGAEIRHCRFNLDTLRNADEVLVCNSVIGVWPVIKLVEDANVITWPIGEICQKAKQFKHELFNPQR